jgi:sialidase-1
MVAAFTTVVLRTAAADAPRRPGVQEPVQIDVFVAATEGYHTFRIPALLATPRGALLAICEGRKQGRGDSGDIDIVLRRSDDRGATWGPLQVVADDGPNTIGNPCPVVDRDTGTIWMALTGNLGADTQREILGGTSRGTRTAWVTRSADDGQAWSPRIDITNSVKAPNWTWYATGPGVAIQLRSGRLLVPCDHYVAGSQAAGSHVIFSDDHGATWKLGGTVGDGVNECQVAELGDGTLLLNMRNTPARPGAGRAVATSADAGMSWSRPVRHPELVEPACQASLIGFLDRASADRGRLRLLFANPASGKRERMTVRASSDGGKTWPEAGLLHAGPSAYSCLAVLPDRTVGCLYERGEKSPYERISFARFDLDWLDGSRSRTPPP